MRMEWPGISLCMLVEGGLHADVVCRVVCHNSGTAIAYKAPTLSEEERAGTRCCEVWVWEGAQWDRTHSVLHLVDGGNHLRVANCEQAA